MTRAWMLFALAACDPSNPSRSVAKPQPKPPPPPTRRQVDELKVLLGDAHDQSNTVVDAAAIDVCGRIASASGVGFKAEPFVTAWWELYDPIENFFLFECNPRLAERAPIEVRAAAYCAGVSDVNPDWWGLPGSNVEKLQLRLLALGKPVATCLVEVFQNDTRLGYNANRDANELATQRGWTRADLAAGFVGLLIDMPYDANAPSRAALRKALAAKVTGSASP